MGAKRLKTPKKKGEIAYCLVAAKAVVKGPSGSVAAKRLPTAGLLLTIGNHYRKRTIGLGGV